MDVLTPEQRKWNMSQIKGKNTRIEILVRSALHRNGFRYRINQPDLPGKPDIVLKKYNAIIFIHGCFWHYHGCKYSKIPESRSDWWKQKLLSNRDRDVKTQDILKAHGWRVLIVWECDLKHVEGFSAIIDQIKNWLTASTISDKSGIWTTSSSGIQKFE